ncbi:hypothetical protein TVAG_385050 [Trichomonas vaginalis G3]|uniref:Uncharacterized protein n=1 Tax=Trichomonas vaginalis (strain ATCC PRA-98 / G3) TaxID=412133 RepID=A2G0R0_TRIV3|nr:hypothetical protein TVAGG3_0118310 [Trichomonas vaginalis G3]EAX89254.1 hypothetical protein TVAG_385050 [Trichomonas vaginalis G3]KAI5545303.1 hypothetical protein TVAGG3_0118310 [Trichomonas vaginalis G3]|eukprot:XP_001302184.1 hypothetical protein [Trichomonas vaginalis G3]
MQDMQSAAPLSPPTTLVPQAPEPEQVASEISSGDEAIPMGEQSNSRLNLQLARRTGRISTPIELDLSKRIAAQRVLIRNMR